MKLFFYCLFLDISYSYNTIPVIEMMNNIATNGSINAKYSVILNVIRN